MKKVFRWGAILIMLALFVFGLANVFLPELPVDIRSEVKPYRVDNILIGRAHGSNVPGKCSPATSNPKLYKDDDSLTFREWEWSREICGRLHSSLDSNKYISDHGVSVSEVIAQDEDIEPPLKVLKKRCHVQNSIVIWIHSNAKGCDGRWHDARGMSIWTSRGITKSDKFSEIIYTQLQLDIPELYYRADRSDGDADFEMNFNVLMFYPPSILIEVLFQDNRKDVAILKSEEFKERLVLSLTKSLVTISSIGRFK